MDSETLPSSESETARSEADSPMEIGQVQTDSQPAAAASVSFESSRGKSTPEQRAKWKAAKQRLRLLKRETGAILPVLPLSSVLVPGEDKETVDTLGGLPNLEDAALVDWTPEDIQEITDEVVEWLNQLDKDSARKQCELALLTERITKEVEADAEMPSICKKIFKKALPKWITKMLNKTGVSAENKELAEIIVGFLFYLGHRASFKRQIKKLLKENAQPLANEGK